MNSNVYCIILKDSHSVASGIIWNIGVRTDTITVIFMHVCARARNRVVSVCICLICFSFNYIRLKTNVSSLLISNLFQLWILFFRLKLNSSVTSDRFWSSSAIIKSFFIAWFGSPSPVKQKNYPSRGENKCISRFKEASPQFKHILLILSVAYFLFQIINELVMWTYMPPNTYTFLLELPNI